MRVRTNLKGRDKNVKNFLDMMKETLTPKEWELIYDVKNIDDDSHCTTLQNEEQQLLQFMVLWTLKESYIKAVGIGLYLDLQHFEFVPKRNIDAPLHEKCEKLSIASNNTPTFSTLAPHTVDPYIVEREMRVHVIQKDHLILDAADREGYEEEYSFKTILLNGSESVLDGSSSSNSHSASRAAVGTSPSSIHVVTVCCGPRLSSSMKATTDTSQSTSPAADLCSSLTYVTPQQLIMALTDSDTL